MLKSYKIVLSAITTIIVISFQDVLIFSTFFELDHRVKIIKTFMDILLAIMYFGTVYVFIHTMTNFEEKKRKYNSISANLSVTTFGYFFGISSAIFSTQDFSIRLMFFTVGVISIFASIYFAKEAEREKLIYLSNND